MSNFLTRLFGFGDRAAAAPVTGSTMRNPVVMAPIDAPIDTIQHSAPPQAPTADARAPSTPIALSSATSRTNSLKESAFASVFKDARVTTYKVRKFDDKVDSEIAVFRGSMTAVRADAYVVPQFESLFRGSRLGIGLSEGGVAKAVANSGADIEAYARAIRAANKEQHFGDVIITETGGGNAKKLINVVSVGTEENEWFSVIQTSVYNALRMAAQDSIDVVIFPLLGTGILEQIPPKQAAQAMLSAIERYKTTFRGTLPSMIAIAVYGPGYEDVVSVMESGSEKLLAIQAPSGQRPAKDAERFRQGMITDYGVDPFA